ncbi:alanine dehydrogenase [Vallitalea okinawensis]|uniref:alanine dehydrogenase n=1 Tax=Vallitalea okinawensis TaxID=2078660 RepID=UPI000CFD2FC8|nr:alanine dehydrogenase [Vallitalea okinawensis]
MIIGVPKEIKNNENRVGLTPGGVKTLVKNGHSALVEATAGVGSGFSDQEYIDAGAQIYHDKEKLFLDADMIVKVKEPLACEYDLFKEGQTLYTYLHLAPNPELTKALLDKKVTGIAYETVEFPDRSLPLLTPMSAVAGRMSVQVGAHLLQKYVGGIGMLLGGVPGVKPAEVVIIGGGVVGTNAAKMAVGLGAHVTILDVNNARLAYLDDIFEGRVTTLAANDHNLEEAIKNCDLLVGAVLVTGESAPKIVTEDMVKAMHDGAVIVDVAIDQGGSIETIDRVTTHDNPFYVKHGVLHYSVANMPGAVPRTSTFALESATLGYAVKLANMGPVEAMKADPCLRLGLNTYDGQVTHEGVADSLGYEYKDPMSLF